MSSSLQLLPLVYSHDHAHTQKVPSVLPFFGFINMTISCGITIYRAYNNKDSLMIVFIIFVYFGSFLLDYWFRLYHKLPSSSHRLYVKIGIWVLLSSIMLGFACKFSTFMSTTESLCFFGIVIGGNAFLFYVYFIWECDKSASACSTNDTCFNNDHNKEYYNYKPLTETKIVDNV